LRTHRNNIARYRRLLKTKLSDLERQFIERRLSEEQLDFERLAESAFPISFNVPPTATDIDGSRGRVNSYSPSMPAKRRREQ